MKIILMDKPAYKKEEYLKIRAHNREICRHNPEQYGRTQLEWAPNYELSIEGVPYVFEVWNKGLQYIKKYYGVKLQKYGSYKTLFVLGKRLPDNIDYAIYSIDTDFSSVSYYVSRKCKFETFMNEDSLKIVPHYGSNEDIKEVVLSV